MKRFLLFFFCVVLIHSLFTSCNTGKKTETAVEVKVSEDGRSLLNLPFYIAVSEGFFRKEGLEINVKSNQRTDGALKDVLMGQAEIGLSDPAALIVSDNQRIRIFAVIAEKSGQSSSAIPSAVFYTNKGSILKSYRVLERFTRAVYLAEKHVNSLSAEELSEKVITFFPGQTKEELTEVIKCNKNSKIYCKTPFLSSSSFYYLQQKMENEGLLKKRVLYEYSVITEFAEKAVARKH